jgi:predicted N-formylglutamate amidohydrolase
MSYTILNPDDESPFLFVCEHASKAFPEGYGTLGLDPEILPSISDWYDDYAKDILLKVLEELPATTLYANYSRLFIDVHRYLDEEELIRTYEKDQNIVIPGNQNLSEAEVKKRVDFAWTPFHENFERLVAEKKKKHKKVYLIAFHTCSPVFCGEKRKFDIDILFRHDKGLALTVGDAVELFGYNVQYNHPPFNGTKGVVFTVDRYSDDDQVEWVFFEVNHGIIKNAEDVSKIAEAIIVGLGCVSYED